MKLSYWTQGVADADDALLKQAITDGHVPSKCLLGGVVVQSIVEVNEDPCATCDGPRHQCGGRPRKSDAVPEIEQHSGDASAYKKAQRKSFIRKLDAMLKGAES